MFEGSLAYKAKYGTFPSTTQREVLYNGMDLCRWVSYQRTAYKNAHAGKPGALSVDRIEKLKKVDFDFGILEEAAHSSDEQEFKWLTPPEAWNNMFDGLLTHKAEHGAFPLSTKNAIFHNGKDLGKWIANQRATRTRKKVYQAPCRPIALQSWRRLF
jgi:hypothetical protein